MPCGVARLEVAAVRREFRQGALVGELPGEVERGHGEAVEHLRVLPEAIEHDVEGGHLRRDRHVLAGGLHDPRAGGRGEVRRAAEERRGRCQGTGDPPRVLAARRMRRQRLVSLRVVRTDLSTVLMMNVAAPGALPAMKLIAAVTPISPPSGFPRRAETARSTRRAGHPDRMASSAWASSTRPLFSVRSLSCQPHSQIPPGGTSDHVRAGALRHDHLGPRAFRHHHLGDVVLVGCEPASKAARPISKARRPGPTAQRLADRNAAARPSRPSGIG